MSVFKDYSKYYDLLYRDKPYEVEADYIAKLISQYANEPKKLLELGVGTAKHALCLAKKGYSIDGVDLSSTMLQMAQKQCAAAPTEIASRLNLQQGDIRNFKTQKQYDCAFSLFHVMSYQTTNQDLISSFQTVKQHVKQGGIFIFDCWYGPAVLSQQPQVRFLQLQNDELRVERVAKPTINVNHNTVDVHYHLFIQTRDSDAFVKVEETHKMRYLFLPEIEALCQQFNMRILYAKEWLTEKTLSEETWGACFVLEL